VEPENQMTEEITAQALADLLGLSLARIGQLAKEGIISRQKSFKYLPSAITQYCQWLRQLKTEKAKKPEGDDFREKLIEEQHREKKRENDLADKLIAPVSMISDTIIKTGSVIMANLESLPGEMKRANPELTAHDINIVRKCISKCCQAIAESKLDK